MQGTHRAGSVMRMWAGRFMHETATGHMEYVVRVKGLMPSAHRPMAILQPMLPPGEMFGSSMISFFHNSPSCTSRKMPCCLGLSAGQVNILHDKTMPQSQERQPVYCSKFMAMSTAQKLLPAHVSVNNVQPNKH